MFIYRIPTDLSRTKSSIPEILSPMRMPEFDSHFQLHPCPATQFLVLPSYAIASGIPAPEEAVEGDCDMGMTHILLTDGTRV